MRRLDWLAIGRLNCLAMSRLDRLAIKRLAIRRLDWLIGYKKAGLDGRANLNNFHTGSAVFCEHNHSLRL